MNRTFYRVTSSIRELADWNYSKKKDAIACVKRHLDGCPDYPIMKKEDREYWQEVGKTMKVYKVTERSVLVKA